MSEPNFPRIADETIHELIHHTHFKTKLENKLARMYDAGRCDGLEQAKMLIEQYVPKVPEWAWVKLLTDRLEEMINE